MDPSAVVPAAAAGAALKATQTTEAVDSAVVPPALPLPIAAGAEGAVMAPVVTPLAVPWLHHDGFPMVKKVCSESGLPQAKKTSVVRVLQELRKGRTNIDQQLAHLETQLLRVSDFLSGATPTLEIATDEANAGDATAATQSDIRGDAVQNGELAGAGDKSVPIDPVATLVEEDLAAETPCTTVGLWRYLSVFSFFKAVTLEDMQEALLLEDPALVVPVEANDPHDTDSVDTFAAVNGLPPLDDVDMHHTNGKGESASSVHDQLRMRLLAAILPVETVEENGRRNENIKETAATDSEKETANDCHEKDARMTATESGCKSEHPIEDDVNMAGTGNGHLFDHIKVKEDKLSKMTDLQESLGDSDVDMTIVAEDFLHPEASMRTLHQLRDVGLIEAPTEEIARYLSDRHDDEVSCEIRALQSELMRQVRRNNEVKRTLRRALERLKPWLTHDEEYQQIETKFQKMWHRKKELQRKRKHKEKKLQRKEASYKSAFIMPPQPSVPS